MTSVFFFGGVVWALLPYDPVRSFSLSWGKGHGADKDLLTTVK